MSLSVALRRALPLAPLLTMLSLTPAGAFDYDACLRETTAVQAAANAAAARQACDAKRGASGASRPAEGHLGFISEAPAMDDYTFAWLARRYFNAGKARVVFCLGDCDQTRRFDSTRFPRCPRYYSPSWSSAGEYRRTGSNRWSRAMVCLKD